MIRQKKFGIQQTKVFQIDFVGTPALARTKMCITSPISQSGF